MKIFLIISLIFLASCSTTVDNRPNYVKLEEKKREVRQNF